MKACPNCRYVYEDDYNGQCHECGKNLGGVAANGSPDLQFRYANQLAQGRRENSQETAMKRGNYGSVQMPASLVDVANSFIIVDEEKLNAASE